MRGASYETSFFVGQVLRVLMVETRPAEAERCLQELERYGYRVRADVVGAAADFAQQLGKGSHDVVLSAYDLGGWTGLEVLELLGKLEQHIPFILIAGALDDDTAARIIDQGADDCILEDDLRRLPLAVRRVLREQRLFAQLKKAGEERERLLLKLQDTLAEIKRLNGLLPICVTCKRILTVKGFWSRMELYIERYSDARISPTICPECASKRYPQHFS